MIPIMGAGCGDVQNDYYEISVIVGNEQPFYFIDPTAGKDTISQKQFGSGKSQFLYLYEPIEGVNFS